jgi:TPR repeat protein
MPDGASREQLTVVLATNGGVQLARLSPVIEIRPESDFKASLGKNDNEDKASVLLEHGKARIADGDVIGARMFFKKGADTGDARAAMAMGATFDPNLFASLQVQGMVPDVKAARQWYERAINLGSKDAQDRLERLNSR